MMATANANTPPMVSRTRTATTGFLDGTCNNSNRAADATAATPPATSFQSQPSSRCCAGPFIGGLLLDSNARLRISHFPCQREFLPRTGWVPKRNGLRLLTLAVGGGFAVREE